MIITYVRMYTRLMFIRSNESPSVVKKMKYIHLATIKSIHELVFDLDVPLDGQDYNFAVFAKDHGPLPWICWVRLAIDPDSVWRIKVLAGQGDKDWNLLITRIKLETETTWDALQDRIINTEWT